MEAPDLAELVQRPSPSFQSARWGYRNAMEARGDTPRVWMEAPDLAELVQRRVSARDTTALLEKLAEEQGQDDRGAEGVKATAAALAMAQVQVLLIHDDPADARTAWFGSDPPLVALAADGLRDLGIDEPQSGRLVDVFLRSALGTGAGMRIVPQAGRVREDVAAILRWA